MSFRDEINKAAELAREAMAEKKEEREQLEREQKKVQLICPYCGTSSIVVWEEGRLPGCPSCGAAFSADDPQIEKLREEMREKANLHQRAREAAAIDSAKTRNKIRRYVIIGILVIVLLIVAVIATRLNGGSLRLEGGGSFNFHIS